MAANLSNLPLLTKNKSNVTMYHFAACVNEYFNDADETEETQITSAEDPIYEGFKAVLDSKSTDETMVISSFGKIIIVIIIMILCTFHYIQDLFYYFHYLFFSCFGTEIEQALHASWEPRHSRHCYRYPWQQYVKLGAVLRQFGYTVVALHGCLRTEIQVIRYTNL